MALTSQDIKKGIDFTGLEEISASELNQSVDTARPADDKGFNVETTDSALNTPVVPNPNVALLGVSVTHWKRYIWLRKPYNNTYSPKIYTWNEQATSDPTYLKWIEYTASEVTQAELDAVSDVADDALSAANTAQASATTANTTATNAANTANTANTTANNVANSLSTGFETPSGGKYRILAENVIGLSGWKLFGKLRLLSTNSSAGTVALTGWTHIDLTSYLNLHSLGAIATSNLAVVLKVVVRAGFDPATATTDGNLWAYFAHDNTYLTTESRFVNLNIRHPTLTLTRESDSLQIILPLSAAKGFYWRWESTAELNALEIYLEGFIQGISTVV